MINVLIMDNLSRRNVIIDPEKTIKEIFEDNNIPYGSGTIMLNGVVSTLDDVIGDYVDDGSNATLSVVAKSMNAVHIKCISAGSRSITVIVSNIKKADYDNAREFNPNALKVVDEDNNEIFKLSFDAEKNAALSDFYALFNELTEEENLQMTLTLSKSDLMKKPDMLLKLKAVEDNIEAGKAELDAKRAAVEKMFED